MEQAVQDALQGAELLVHEGVVLDDELLMDDLLEDVGTLPPLALGCWGRQLCGEDQVCSPGFLAGHGHFKNKFCGRCRSDGIYISSDRICLASQALHDHFNNSNGRTVWTKGARLVNQTAKCTGPPVLIFQGLVPEAVAAAGAPVPEAWLGDGGPHSGAVSDVHFLVSKGTLVPSGLCATARKGKVMRPVAGSGSTAASTSVSDQAVADETVETRHSSAVKRARGEVASPTSLADTDASRSDDGWSTSVANASPPRTESDEDAGHAPPYPWTSHEPPGMLEPMGFSAYSPWFHAPPPPAPTTTTMTTMATATATIRRSLLASHDDLVEQIRAALACGRSEGRVDTVSKEASDHAERSWEVGFGLGQLGACAPPSLTSREMQALSSLLPLLKSSAALLRSELQEPSRPPTAGTLPPSPPSSRPSTAGTCSHAASLVEVAIPPHRGSTTRDVQPTEAHTTRETFTQTPVHIDYTKGGLLVVAYLFMGLSFATAGGIAFQYSFARLGEWRWLISSPGVVACYVVSGMFFHAGCVMCSWLLDRFGVVDDRMVHVLKTNSLTRWYANRKLRRRMRRYAVMDDQNKDVHFDDIKANRGRLCRLIVVFNVVCVFLLICGLVLPRYYGWVDLSTDGSYEEDQWLISKFQNADQDGNGWLDPGELQGLLGRARTVNASSSANFTHPPGCCVCG